MYLFTPYHIVQGRDIISREISARTSHPRPEKQALNRQLLYRQREPSAVDVVNVLLSCIACQASTHINNELYIAHDT
jgi:hypothetical protein